jgi:hypothetical protein
MEPEAIPEQAPLESHGPNSLPGLLAHDRSLFPRAIFVIIVSGNVNAFPGIKSVSESIA